MALKLGGMPGNPGYSFPAPRFNFRTFRYEKQPIAYFGPPGTDTLENRQKFVEWCLSQNPYMRVGSFMWGKEPDPSPTYKVAKPPGMA